MFAYILRSLGTIKGFRVLGFWGSSGSGPVLGIWFQGLESKI